MSWRGLCGLFALVALALVSVVQTSTSAETASPGKVVVVHRSPNRTLYAPTVSGQLVAWLSARGRPTECGTSLHRVEVLLPDGRTQYINPIDAHAVHHAMCVFRPVAAHGSLYWSERGRLRPLTRTYFWSRDQRPLRARIETVAFIGPSYDMAFPTQIVTGRSRFGDGNTTRYTIDRIPGSSGVAPGVPRIGLNLWTRFLDANDIIFVVPGATQISGTAGSLPLPASFDGLDAGDGRIVVRSHDASGYSLIEIDPTSGSQRVLLSSVEQLSLPAVAARNAAVLRRDRNSEQLLLIPLGGGAPRVLAARAGAPLWGAREIADGRPVAYDGTRVVFTAGRSVLAVTPPAP